MQNGTSWQSATCFSLLKNPTKVLAHAYLLPDFTTNVTKKIDCLNITVCRHAPLLSDSQ